MHKNIPKKADFPGAVVGAPISCTKALLKDKYLNEVNGGSHFWNPPFFSGRYFTAPFFVFFRQVRLLISRQAHKNRLSTQA